MRDHLTFATVSIASVMLVAGCTTTTPGRYDVGGADRAVYETAYVACEAEAGADARRAVGGVPLSGGNVAARVIGGYPGLVMEQTIPDARAARDARREAYENVINACLEARGFPPFRATDGFQKFYLTR
jgi:hypothetical protein